MLRLLIAALARTFGPNLMNTTENGMRLNHWTSGILALALLTLGGCSSLPSFGTKPSQMQLGDGSTPIPPTFMPSQQSMDPVALALAQSAQQIQKAVHEMKEITVATKLPDVTPNRKAQMDAMEMSIPPGLGSRISLSFDGSFTTLVEGITKSVGWSYVVEGERPPIIQVVHKEYKQVRAVDALRDIGYTLQGPSLIIDSINRRIIVRF